MADILKQQWNRGLALKPKLRTYVQFKSLLEPEKYLHLNCSRNVLQIFACFRCSVLPLAIEEGRRQNIDPLARLCKLCSRESVEDEYHFLLVCPLYDNLRKEHLSEDANSEPNFHKFLKLMSGKDSKEMFKLCNFVYKAFKLRESVLKSSEIT